jgi:hypothetical protein
MALMPRRDHQRNDAQDRRETGGYTFERVVQALMTYSMGRCSTGISLQRLIQDLIDQNSRNLFQK